MLQNQVMNLLNQEKLIINYTEEISLELKLRSKAARQLSFLKSKLKLCSNFNNVTLLQNNINELEKEIQTRSKLILTRQGYLFDINNIKQNKNYNPWDGLCKSDEDYKVFIYLFIIK